MKKIVIISTNGLNREDGNVYYSKYVIVSSDTLKFDEPIFTNADHGPCKNRPLLTDDDCSDPRMNAVIAEIEALGYTVERPEIEIVTVEVG